MGQGFAAAARTGTGAARRLAALCAEAGLALPPAPAALGFPAVLIVETIANDPDDLAGRRAVMTLGRAYGGQSASISVAMILGCAEFLAKGGEAPSLLAWLRSRGVAALAARYRRDAAGHALAADLQAALLPRPRASLPPSSFIRPIGRAARLAGRPMLRPRVAQL